MKTNATAATRSPLPPVNLEPMTKTMSEAAERGHAFMEQSLRTLEAEVNRFFEDYQAHSRATLEAVRGCTSPIDLLVVEQQWVKNRTQSYIDSGLRFAQAFAGIAKNLGGEPPERPIPTATGGPPPA
jgi:hypothetical protein